MQKKSPTLPARARVCCAGPLLALSLSLSLLTHLYSRYFLPARRTALCALSLLLASLLLLPCGFALAANSGGALNKPLSDDYSHDGATGGNVIIDSNVTGAVYGGYINTAGSTDVTGNKVTINGGTVSDIVAGGATVTATNAIGNVSNNTVTITGGTMKDVYGGRSRSVTTGNVTGNTVNISGGTFSANIYGGTAAASSTGNVTGNTVNISGGTFAASTIFYGGYQYCPTVFSKIALNRLAQQ